MPQPSVHRLRHLSLSNSHSWPTNWLKLSCLWFLSLTMAQGGWDLDIETRCVQEVVDAGEVRILQHQKRKKWWRGQWGKSTYEVKSMQEIERHLGGRGKFDIETGWAQKVVERYAPTYLSPPLSSIQEGLFANRVPPIPMDYHNKFSMFSPSHGHLLGIPW